MKSPKSFEEGMSRLDAILDQMQQEDTTLTNSASLMDYCHAALEKASLQMDEIDAKRAPTVPDTAEE